MSGPHTPYIPPLFIQSPTVQSPTTPRDTPHSQNAPGPATQPIQQSYWPPQEPDFPWETPPAGPFYGAGIGTPYNRPFIPPQPYSTFIGGQTPLPPPGSSGLVTDYTGFPTHLPASPMGQTWQLPPPNPGAWPGIHPNTGSLHHTLGKQQARPASPWYPQSQPQHPMHFSTPMMGFGGAQSFGDPFAGGGWHSPPNFYPGTIPPVMPGGGGFNNTGDGAMPRYSGAERALPQPPWIVPDTCDQAPKWTPGQHYGPVLTPLQLKIVEERLEINPLLLPVPEEEEKPIHLNWNMLMPASLVHRSDDHHQISWSKGRSEPATFPRITQLIIVSSHFPWRINVRAQDQEAGVTCGEVIDTIARSMDKLTSASEYNDLSKEKKAMIKRAYRHNRSRSADVPGGRLGEGMKRMDFLCDLTEFGGLEVEERIVQKTCSVALPGYVVLRCDKMKTLLEPEQTGTQTTIHNTIINHEVAVLDRLLPHICPDAALDSDVRSPSPRCHPGTCQRILDILNNWLITHLWKLFWLSAPVGAGKSAIAQTFAEICLQQGCLGAAYFFIRSSDSHHPRTLIPTLAFQLAVNVPDYEKNLKTAVLHDPSIFHKSRRVQLQKLIVEPFMLLLDQKPDTAHKPLFIILDGLDECRSIEAQCEIVEIVGEVIRLQKDLPLLWFITSRPEPHLQNAFSQADFSIDCNREVLWIDSDTREDVNRYLRESFKDKRTKFSLATDVAWPSEEHLHKLEDIAAGLFALAATIVRYVFDVEYGDPVRRLTDFLAFMSDMDSTTTTNPLQTLDQLYSQILSDIPEDVYQITKRILAFHFTEGLSHFPVSLCCGFLHISRDAFRGAVKKLHSLFDIPLQDAEGSMCAHHPSFRDYLQSQSRSGKFHISNHFIADCISKECLFWYKIILKEPLWVSDDPFQTIYKSAMTTVLPGVGWGGAQVSQLIRKSVGHLLWACLASLGSELTKELLIELEDFDFRYALVTDGPTTNFSRFTDNWVGPDYSMIMPGPHTSLLHSKPQDQVERVLLDRVVNHVGRPMEPAILPMAEISDSESLLYRYLFIGHGIRSSLFWFDEKCFLSGRCRLGCKVPVKDMYYVSDCVIHLPEEFVLE